MDNSNSNRNCNDLLFLYVDFLKFLNQIIGFHWHEERGNEKKGLDSIEIGLEIPASFFEKNHQYIK